MAIEQTFKIICDLCGRDDSRSAQGYTTISFAPFVVTFGNVDQHVCIRCRGEFILMFNQLKAIQEGKRNARNAKNNTV